MHALRSRPKEPGCRAAKARRTAVTSIKAALERPTAARSGLHDE